MADHEPRYLFGLHDPGGESIMLEAGKPGWVLITEGIGHNPDDQSGRDYSDLADKGLGVIVRLNNGYGSAGTIPLPQYYDAFAQRCANFVSNSWGCHIWIIGNEMNHAQERPEGQPITPDLYAQCFIKCRNAIKAQAGGVHKVIVGAVAPYNNQTTYPGNESGDWIKYFSDVLNLLQGAAGSPSGPGAAWGAPCDGIALHAYTWGPDPSLVTSEERMDPPFENRRKQFRVYRDFMEAIPENMRHLPVYITETDQMWQWEDVNSGWVQKVYEEIDNWNRQGKQQIRCVILYRWSTADQWNISGKQGVIADFKAALQHNYVWGYAPPPPPKPKERFFPETGKTVRGPFLDFFNRYGLDICGYPITDQFEEWGMPSQYFQRVALEEYEPGRVRLKLVGSEAYESRAKIRELEKRIAALEQQVAAPVVSPLVVKVEKPPIVDLTEDLPRHASKRWPTRSEEEIKYLIIHHTVTSPNLTPQRLAQVQVENQDLPGITGHFFIGADGTIYQTNPLNALSEQAGEFSRAGVGILFPGDFTDTIPTQEQLRAGGQLCAWLLQELKLPLGAIKGLSELIATQSPGLQWMEGQKWKEMLLNEVRKAKGGERYFPETGKTVRGPFLAFFNRYGLDICGYPITDEFMENGIPTQYFQRVALEEYEPGKIRLRLVGSEAWEARTKAKPEVRPVVAKPPIQDITDELPKHPTKRYNTRRLEDITHIAVHHSGVDPSVPVERIARYHVENLDWPGIGYHFEIASDGTIHQTNKLTTVSYHASEANAYAIGVCFAGDFTSTIPTEAQLRSGGHLIAWLLQKLNLPLDRVQGHKYFVNTRCPGDQWDSGQRWGDMLRGQIQNFLLGIPEKPLYHYLLFWQTAEDWAREDWLGAEKYVGRFRPTCGFSVDDAKQAKHVTVVGGPLGVPDSVIEELRASGCLVERVAGDSPEATKALLDQMAEEGRRFLRGPQAA